MNSIFSIYKRDLSRIVTNWAALIVIFALILLPSFYAWFNIKASWDPYGNTKGLKVAVSIEDAGAVIRGEHVNTGKRIMDSLKTNKKLGWVFTDSKDADRGVRHGDYYASILIPSDFSKKLGSVLTDNPVKPDIIYKVNEKINPIAPKITEKGAAGIVQEVSEKNSKR
ncbi:YhgE/Pip domain-containing protein [Metabacillus sp. RGM 3146]|uniref:YhgE/Pip domain-containing protein n=1 Tax=Metabacillus sp. RGM 3146 TaxID=3401092 RepID=UPI003B99606E